MTTLSLIVPVLNEADAVQAFIEQVDAVFNAHPGIDLEFVFINDGSTDQTLATLLNLQAGDERIRIVDLSRNFGKEAALSAGLDASRGEAVVVIDVDLQDPPELIPLMLEQWRAGYEVVQGRRASRAADSRAKRLSAKAFYVLHNKLARPRIPENVGDFRLMDRCVVEALKSLPESRRFMKGLFAWAGFRSTWVEYDRPARVAGSTKFNGWKLWNLALEGVTSFSTAPLQIWTYVGFTVSLTAFIYGFTIIAKVLIHGVDVPGYASLMASIMFLGGLQLIGIGVLGEYLGRTYIESKRRPVYLVRRIYERPAPQPCAENQAIAEKSVIATAAANPDHAGAAS